MQTITSREKLSLKGAITSPPLIKDDEPKTLKMQSRFGEVEVEDANRIFFQHGLLGIPSAVSFCLTALPGIQGKQFKLLQCLDDEGLSFIVVPSGYDNQLIKSEDLDDACKVLNFNPKNLLLLFIVTVHEKGRERRLSVNAKAPVIVDVFSKTATQYVLGSDEYKIQHMIS